MDSFEERLTQVEQRLERLERLFMSLRSAKAKAPETPTPTPTPAAPAPAQRPVQQPVQRAAPRPGASAWNATPAEADGGLSVTQILGWTGVTALVLAAAYLIRLAVDVGWLTPARQLGLAVMSGVSLIATGVWLRRADRQYASLLPACGLVVLFLSIYGAHLYYHFITAQAAASAVILACITSLWLSRLFESELYGLFAVVGSYSAPFLLHSLSGSVFDLAIYYTAWSGIFCVFAIWIGARRTYLLAAYMALLGFHFVWGRMAPGEWQGAFAFQVVQFAIFLGAAVYFSIRHKRPMTFEEAVAHLPLLLIFYALQYALLNRHLPAFAPWIALGSAALLLVAYGIARKTMDGPLRSGEFLVGAYASLALFHAGYMELVPHGFEPWVGLLAVAAVGLYLWVRGGEVALQWPVKILVGLVFVLNYLRVVTNVTMSTVPAHDLLAVLYAVELYVAYYLARRLASLAALATPVLYAGHVALMVAAVHILDGRLAVSFVWGLIAIACLLLAFMKGDKTLGKSSLLIFAASVAKVMLFDLSLATPLVRIGSLVILGVTLYLGGWMYKKVDQLESNAT